jgi:hypothetical protein
LLERADIDAALAALLDIRRELARIRTLLEEEMGMKSERTRRALERAERELRNDPTVRLLEERIAYHRAKLAEERASERRRSHSSV